MTDEPLIGLSKEGDLDKVIETDDITDCFKSIEIPELYINIKMEQKKKIIPPKARNDGQTKGGFDF